MYTEVTAQEPALAIGERIGAGAHFSQIVIGADMDTADKIEIVVQHLKEVTALLLRLSIYHWQVK